MNDPGLVRGFGAPFRGIAALLRRPSAWSLAAVPVLLLVVVATLGVFGARAAWRWLGARMAFALGHVGAVIVEVLVAFVLIGAVVTIAATIVPALAAPFMDALAARFDLRTEDTKTSLHQLLRSVRVALAGVVFVAVPQLALWALAFAMPWLAPLCAALAVTITALGLAFDALDWPLSRRGLGVRARLAWMRMRPASVIGLALAVWLFSIVPGLSLLLLPAIVVGAVQLVGESERGLSTAR